MTAAIATPEPIKVVVRPADTLNELRMAQAQWSRELNTGWKHRTRLPGDKPGQLVTVRTGSMQEQHRKLEERSGVQVGKPGFDQAGVRHEPYVIAHRAWKHAHRLLVDSLIESGTLLIAVLPDVPTEPIGWAAFGPLDDVPTLHFVYVAPAARRSTIATQLVLACKCSAASHMTPEGRGLAKYLRGKA